MEVLLATVLMCFLVGFVCVLCWGNWFRAQQAQERQLYNRRKKQEEEQEQQLLI